MGGRTGSYERLFEQGQSKAIEELEKRAQRLGADAVIGIQFDTGTININVEQSGVMLLITATGTIVSQNFCGVGSKTLLLI